MPLLCLELLTNLLNMFEICRHQSVSHLNMSQFVTSLSIGRQQVVFALLPMQVFEKFGKTSRRFVTSLTRISNLLYKVVTNLIMPYHVVSSANYMQVSIFVILYLFLTHDLGNLARGMTFVSGTC